MHLRRLCSAVKALFTTGSHTRSTHREKLYHMFVENLGSVSPQSICLRPGHLGESGLPLGRLLMLPSSCMHHLLQALHHLDTTLVDAAKMLLCL